MEQKGIFKVNSPYIVSELIDGELVIMNLKSGNYYSVRDTGVFLWSALEKGCGQDEMLALLTEAYNGDIPSMIEKSLFFIKSLLDNDLVSQAMVAQGPNTWVADQIMGQPLLDKFTSPPVLEVFSDMQDLLLLDPIHDIAEQGWPVAKPSRPAE